MTKQELREETPLLPEHINASRVSRIVERIDEALRDVDCDKKVKRRGKDKVEVEFGLLAIAHNLAKAAS